MSGSDSTYTVNFGDGNTVLERVLLAIIEAHTTPGTEDRQQRRLETALAALIGPATRKGHDMDKALLFMARERQKNICDLEMHDLHSFAGSPRYEARSIPELAILAAGEVMGSTTASEVEASARVLCDIFRQRCRVNDMEQDHVREAREAEAVRRILDELAEWDVPTRL
jgi:hypothetical protein